MCTVGYLFNEPSVTKQTKPDESQSGQDISRCYQEGRFHTFQFYLGASKQKGRIVVQKRTLVVRCICQKRECESYGRILLAIVRLRVRERTYTRVHELTGSNKRACANPTGHCREISVLVTKK